MPQKSPETFEGTKGSNILPSDHHHRFTLDIRRPREPFSDDPDWSNVIKESVKAFVRARRSAKCQGLWSPGASHRRGGYFTLTTGVSFGGGQRRPGNLRNSRALHLLIRRLLRNPAIQRLAGFQSSGFAICAQKLFKYYCHVLKSLFQRHPGLIQLP
ncbi:hypothetical protein B0H14DRAFT_3444452 [Mycena olivaceomarginata]|nr:hypothetical protein B0H14DRAFT_3444452 [Mycena olivaceomarginata]